MSLSVEKLTCVRSDHLVFEDVSFDVPAGEALWIRGQNGAGKSSLLRICATLLKPVQGDLKWQGKSCFDDPERYLNQLLYVGHQDALKSALTVAENLNFWAEYLGEGTIDHALSEFELGPLRETPTGFLSAGQKKRVNLARLLIVKAPLWILDEPFSSLDQTYVELMKNHMDRHLEEGGTILYSTHQPLSLSVSSTLDLDAMVSQ
ncbi:heme ABC exporter ATP-binding protein CcmA [Sneathiella marina]|uniref:Heme ABC exporter ATP-binding protein CcmA n=1 Tax=Sneathiella marina TaxID=2950108 RepID=A0ABY4W3L1_9PROT|nr:heme ABC exporter ATP-binding protein CcmA [Sneathiella marina]USG61638.1 heme ABC exporter ATP-binding protein CcmA [Sneathiella marina]